MDLNIIPSSDKLKVLYEKDYRICVLYGGRGSGKSLGVAEFLVIESLKSSVNILCCRDLAKSVGPSSFADLTRTMKRLGVEHLFEITRQHITCKINDSKFEFTGLRTNTEDNLKSRSAINYVWIEEAATVKEEAWHILEPSIREKDSRIIITFNPRLETDFMSDYFISGKVLPPNTKVVKINYYDNRYFWDTELVSGMEHMKEHDIKMYTHVYEGEHLAQGDNKIFNASDLNEALKRKPVIDNEKIIAAVDLARYGNDSSVLCVREGNKFHPLKKWNYKEVDEMVDILIGEVLTTKIDVLIVDSGGLGVGHFAYLRKGVGNICNVVEYNSQNTPYDKKRFANARAETHFLAAEHMSELGNVPDDRELRKQILNIEYTYHKVNNKLLVELKEEYKDRNNQESPDELDAYTMCFYKGWVSRTLDKNKLKGRRR